MVRVPVNSMLVVVKFWWSQKFYADFQLHRGAVPQPLCCSRPTVLTRFQTAGLTRRSSTASCCPGLGHDSHIAIPALNQCRWLGALTRHLTGWGGPSGEQREAGSYRWAASWREAETPKPLLVSGGMLLHPPANGSHEQDSTAEKGTAPGWQVLGDFSWVQPPFKSNYYGSCLLIC